MPTPASIKFDFSYYLPVGNTDLGIYKLPEGQCVKNNFILSVICSDLVPGNFYQITYQVLNPGSNPGNKVNIFNPSTETIYASFKSQTFATLADLDVIGEYILQATIFDQANNTRSSAICTLQCGDTANPSPTPTPTQTVTPSRFSRQNNVTVELVDPGYDTVNDNIIVIPSGIHEFPLVGLAKNTIIGYRYNYEFFDVPANSVVFEKKKGEFFSGSSTQNFNSKISFGPEGQYSFIYATVTDAENNITKFSDPILFKAVGTTLENINLPSGIDVPIGAPTFRSCALRGLTNQSISNISGGKGFAIGDKLSPEGGQGYGAEIQIVSGGITIDTFTSISGGVGYNVGDYIAITGGGGTGGLIQITSGGITNASINLNSISGCTGFSVGDLLTTTGGGGVDAVIKVMGTGIGGTITSLNVINPGHGYTYAPNGLVSLNKRGSCTNIVFNADNFTIPAAGGISSNSISLQGGTGYDIGEVIDIIGGGGVGAKVQLLSGSLTQASISGASLPTGTGFSVGDLLTTTGGDGQGAVIKVLAVDSQTGAITRWEVINGGYGFTSAPTGLSVLQCSSSNCTPASISANSSNFAITASGSITKSSISGLINTGTGYKVGDTLSLVGGNGGGAKIEITSVDGNGKILDFTIISGGSGYTGSPIVINDNGMTIVPQPTFDVSKFTNQSFVIISAGSGYINPPSQFISENGGDGSGLIANFNPINFTDPSFIVVNSGSGYTGAPTGLQRLTGDGSGLSATFNSNNFTIPAVGGITPESLYLVGGTGYNIGEVVNIVGGGGSGAQIKVMSGSLTDQSITSLVGGSGYAVGDIISVSGGGGSDALIKVLSVDSNGGILTWQVINGGYGFTGAPTSIVSLTGNGTGAAFTGNANNFALTEEGGIASNSLSGLIGTNTAMQEGEILYLTGGGGTGAQILITSVDNVTGAILSYVVLNAGSGYKTAPTLVTPTGVPLTVQPSWNTVNFTDKSYILISSGSGYTSAPTSLVSANGDGKGAIIDADVNKFSQLAVNVTNPGSGYIDAPTGVSVLTGYGNISNLNVSFNAQNFIEISGPAPTPTTTPTPTPTPSMSAPVPCNDLQSAGGQNPTYILTVNMPATIGQDYIISSNLPSVSLQNSVLKGANLNSDTYIVSVEDYFRSIDDTAGLKKIKLNRVITGNISQGSELTLYTVDTRIVQAQFWPGVMTFYYDAYSVPDRFKVIGIPTDKTKPEVLLFDSGFRGDSPCGYANDISGLGSGSTIINKPDGMIYIKVIVEAPCEGTAWKYLLTCPIRNNDLITPSPTQTSTTTPTLTPTPSTTSTVPRTGG
jgi:hypothetical protein